MKSHSQLYSADLKPVVIKNPPLTSDLVEKLRQVQLAAFLKTYENVTDAELQIPAGTTRTEWYTELLAQDLAEVNAGLMSLMTVFMEDELMGFATCKNVKPRYPGAYVRGLFGNGKTLETFKNDVHISLLAGRPIQETLSPDAKLMSLGIGKMLVNAVARHFQDANYITLDARHVNKYGIGFYDHNGFDMVLGISFEGHDLAYYRGYEKPTAEHRCKI